MAMWGNVKGASAKVVVLFRCLLNVATSESIVWLIARVPLEFFKVYYHVRATHVSMVC
jgi:hypothetical protein